MAAVAAADPVPTFFQGPPWSRRWLWFVLSSVILVADYLCGPQLLFPILFILPVVLVAWNCASETAIGIALLLTVAHCGARLATRPQVPVLPELLNELIRALVLAGHAILVSRGARQNAKLSRQVKQLEGLIPICANCKRILDEEQHWTRIETYIVEHSQAEFTHGICPDCAQDLYGKSAPNDAAF